MRLAKNKLSVPIIKRSTIDDISNITDFHKKNTLFETPGYLIDILSGHTGFSLVAYQKEQVVGHIIILPLFSDSSPELEEAAIICGIWATNDEVAERLVKEANMTSWESGYHILFCLEKIEYLTISGFKPVSANYFSFDTSGFYPMAMELSWNGCSKISKKQYLPSIYLPEVNLNKQFSKN